MNGTLFETFSLLIPGILACLTILPLLPPSSLTQFNLVWIFSFHLPINLTKSLLQSGSIHIVQKLSNIKATTFNNGNYTKLHIQELYLYKFATYAPKPSIMLNPPLSIASTMKLLHVKQDLAPSGPLPKLSHKTFAILLFHLQKATMAHLHALLPLKLTFWHQTFIPIPILKTKISNLLSTPHPPSQCPLSSSLQASLESLSSAQHLPI